jgi:predicted nucleic acid-binding protein
VIVVDASALLEVLLRTPIGVALEPDLFRARRSLHAPHLIDVEVLQVLRRYRRAGDLSLSRAAEAVADLADFPIARYPHEPLIDRIWALRESMTAYDASYVALAEALGAPLVTCDAKLASARGHGAAIRLARAETSRET